MNDLLNTIKHTYADAMRARTGVGTATYDAQFDKLIGEVERIARNRMLNELARELATPEQTLAFFPPETGVLTHASVLTWLYSHLEAGE